MNNTLTANDLLLISGLIKENNKEITDHMSKEIRMVKMTVQETHNIASEGRDFGKKTNGRVTKLECEMYGEVDTNNKSIKGKEGVLFYLDEVKKLRFTYKTWRHVAVTILVLCAFFIKESREFIWEKFMNFKI